MLALTWGYPAGSVVELDCDVGGAGQDWHPVGCWSWVRSSIFSLLALLPREKQEEGSAGSKEDMVLSPQAP